MIQLVAFVMIFVNIPANANQGETYDQPAHLEKPNKGMLSFISPSLTDRSRPDNTDDTKVSYGVSICRFIRYG